MSQFQFRLETVRKLRLAERDRRRADVAKALEAEQVLQTRIQEVTDELGQIDDRRRKAAESKVIDIDSLTQQHRFALVLKSRLDVLRGQAAQLKEETSRRQDVLAEADREVKALDMIRDKAFEEHRRQEQKREQQLMDEAAQGSRHHLREVTP